MPTISTSPRFPKNLLIAFPLSSQTIVSWSFLGLKFPLAQACRAPEGGGAPPAPRGASRVSPATRKGVASDALPAARPALCQGRARAGHVGRDARVSLGQAPQGLCHQDQRAARI